MNIPDRKCVFCGFSFTPSKLKQKYCTLLCSSQSQKKLITEKCIVCFAEFIRRPSEKPCTCGKAACLAEIRSRNASGARNPMFGKIGPLNPKWGKPGKSTKGHRHSAETKQLLREKWLERTNGGTNLRNLGFKQGIFVSKTGEENRYHSSYELRRMRFLDSHPMVESWTKNHGISIDYSIGGKQHFYIPDFLVKWAGHPFRIEEIKGFISNPSTLMTKNLAAISYCESSGMTFRLLKEADLDRADPQTIVIMEGPDNCGKSHVGRSLSHLMEVPYFRPPNQHELWHKGSFLESLRNYDPLMASFMTQTGFSVIFDRSYASERCYSSVFGRETDDEMLTRLDMEYSRMGAIFVILLRREYGSHGGDCVVPDGELIKLHDAYRNFIEWTRCSCIVMHVDDFNDDIDLQAPVIISSIHEAKSHMKKVVIEL